MLFLVGLIILAVLLIASIITITIIMVKKKNKSSKISQPIPNTYTSPIAPAQPVAPSPAVTTVPAKPFGAVQTPITQTNLSAPVKKTSQEENIQLIKQYKELLDMGAITQEDYDKKKNELLGL